MQFRETKYIFLITATKPEGVEFGYYWVLLQGSPAVIQLNSLGLFRIPRTSPKGLNVNSPEYNSGKQNAYRTTTTPKGLNLDIIRFCFTGHLRLFILKSFGLFRLAVVNLEKLFSPPSPKGLNMNSPEYNSGKQNTYRTTTTPKGLNLDIIGFCFTGSPAIIHIKVLRIFSFTTNKPEGLKYE